MTFSENTIFAPDSRALRVGFVVLPETNTLSFAAAVDPLRAANRRAGKWLFDWSFHAAQDTDIPLTSGARVPCTPLSHLGRCDLLAVLAGFNIDRHLTQPLLAGLRRHHANGATLAGIDGGAWALAHAGLLDGEIATTHWEDLDEMTARFDQVQVVRNRYVLSNRMVTSSGAAPTLDLMLHLIGARHGARLAEQVAGTFLYDPVHDSDRPQSQTTRARLPRKLAQAIALMERRIEEPLPIPGVAEATGISSRQLETLFRDRIGTTPRGYYLSLRLAEAHRLVLDTRLSVQEIAIATGFSSQSAFARAFTRAYGHSVRALRKRRDRLGRPATGSPPPVGRDRAG